MSRAMTASIIVLAVSLACVASAHAETIIYQDDFNGLSGTSLSGTTPDVSLNGEKWSASTYNAAGSITTVVGAGNANAWLPFTLNNTNSGAIYTLSADVNVATASKWIALGFYGGSGTPAISGGSGATGNFLSGMNTVSMISFARAASGDTASAKGYLGPQNTKVTWGPTSVSDTSTDMKNVTIVLNTSTNLWSVAWYIDGISYGSAVYTSNPSITYVGFGVGSTSGVSAAIDNFSLTSTVVPEPSAMGVLASGAFGILAYAWRKRKQG